MKLASCLLICCLCLVPAFGAESEVIMRGKVVMYDGSPLPKAAGLERVCADSRSSRPGPLTSKQGDYIWRMLMDPMKTNVCSIRATMDGYMSTEIDISSMNGYIDRNQQMPDLVLRPADATTNPRLINVTESGVPRKVRQDWDAAVAALGAGNYAVMQKHLEAVVAAEPKFARGWHSLGIVLENERRIDEARAAYEKAIAADAKYMEPLVVVSQLAARASEWQKAIDLSNALIKLDKKRIYPEVYVYIAVAKMELKDLDAAEASAREAINPKEDNRALRGEYVLGRILAAKGDLKGAREHIEQYLKLKPDAPDFAEIQASLATLGQAGATQPSLL
jgi:Flp pilus assembly protein TadD